MTNVPMKIPCVRLRMTAYHSVVASMVPWTGCHGRGGASPSGAMPDSMS